MSKDSAPYPARRVKDLAVGERPQERLEKLGPGALSDAELLAMLLRSGQKGHSVVSISHQLISEAGSLAALTRWREADFRRIRGIGRIKALQLITVMEIATRVLRTESGENPLLNRPELVFAHFRSLATGLSVEKFWVLCLNRKNRLIRQVELTSGTATSSLAHPREVFREAVHHGATSVVCIPPDLARRNTGGGRRTRPGAGYLDLEPHARDANAVHLRYGAGRGSGLDAGRTAAGVRLGS